MARERRFPVVADDQPVIQEAKAMAIYDNEDLITNIGDNYVDKDYGSLAQDMAQEAQERQEASSNGQPEPSPAQQAREEARRSVREKRQRYLAQDVTRRPSQTDYDNSPDAISTVVDFDASPERNNQLARLAERLRQTNYILAELPRHYQKPSNQAKKKQKNSYDFLKTSQVYNHQDSRRHHEVQELNLAQLEEEE